MLKFIEDLHAGKSTSPSNTPSSSDRESSGQAREYRRGESNGKRASFFSSKAEGLLFLPGDLSTPKPPASENSDSTNSNRSSMSFSDPKSSAERSDPFKGRRLGRLSRKPGQLKTPKPDGLTNTSSPLSVVDNVDDADYQGIADESTSSSVGRRRMISQPFDFMHLKHTHRSHLTEIHRLSQLELVSEFAAVMDRQTPSKELNGIHANDLRSDGYFNDALQSSSEIYGASEQAKKAAPIRPKRSDELLTQPATNPIESDTNLRPVRSADTAESASKSTILKATVEPGPFAPRQNARRNFVDGPTIRNLGGLGARQPTGAPQPSPSAATDSAAEKQWNAFETNGFDSSIAPATQTQRTPPVLPSPPAISYSEDPPLSTTYGKELERVPEEPEESRSQRASKELQSYETSPMLPSSECPPPPKKSASRSQANLLVEPFRRSLQSSWQPPSRANSNASDTLGGFIHRPLMTRKSNSSLLSTATGRSRVVRGVGTDSVNWEDEIDFAYEHHMEAHCDLDWNNVRKRETNTSVETVPELDHSATSSARSTQDGSLVPPSSMGIDVLATVKEALSSPDVSGGEESNRRREPHIRNRSRESYLYEDGQPELNSMSSPSDVDDSTLTMSPTTVNSSEVVTPADTAATFPFPIRKQLAGDAPSPTKSSYSDMSMDDAARHDMYEDVLASYELATRPSLDAVIESSSADEAPSVPIRHDSLNVAESRSFQRAALLTRSQHQSKHQRSGSGGMVTDFAVATLKARVNEPGQPEDDGMTPRQSSRLSTNNLKLHTMVSGLRDEPSKPSVAVSEATDEPSSLSSSQVSFGHQDGTASIAPSSTASDDIFDAILGPQPLSAPPIPQRSRSRLERPSLLYTSSGPLETRQATGPAHRRLHSEGSTGHLRNSPKSHGVHFSPRSSSLGTLSPVMTIASEEPVAPVNWLDSKALPALPPQSILRTRSNSRRKSDGTAAFGLASVAAPAAGHRPASKGSVMTAIHTPSADRQANRSSIGKIEKPGYKRASSRVSVVSAKYRPVRHWGYDFGGSEEPEPQPKPRQQQSYLQSQPNKAINPPKRSTERARPITQYNLPSQEILAMGSELVKAKSGSELVAKQYSEMSSDQPAPTFVTTAPPKSHQGFVLSPAPSMAQMKQKSRVRNMTHSVGLDRVLTALQ